MKTISNKTLISVALIIFSSAVEIAAQAAGDWPQWRGPTGMASQKETGLLKQWPENGPPLAWKATGAGAGYCRLRLSTAVFSRWD